MTMMDTYDGFQKPRVCHSDGITHPHSLWIPTLAGSVGIAFRSVADVEIFLDQVRAELAMLAEAA